MNNQKKSLNILVCSLSNADTDPRPNRIIQFLNLTASVSFLGIASSVQNSSFYQTRLRSNLLIRAALIICKILRLHRLTAKLQIATPKDIDFNSFDLIICHSPEFLPVLIEQKRSFKLIFDAREFYPKQFENSMIWKYLNAPFQKYLCCNYLKNVDAGLTVSHGLAQAYKAQFDVHFEVFFSLPFYTRLPPRNTIAPIRLIYHGIATPARQLEAIIAAMDDVYTTTTLDLMLAGNSKYTRFIKAMANRRNNVRVIDAVTYYEIIPTLNEYDAEVIFFPPSTFNLQHCMPNKLFESVQARIAVLAAPLVDLAQFVKEHDIGCVSKSFDSKDLSELINTLTPAKLNYWKSNCDAKALEFSQGNNDAKLNQLMKDLLRRP